MEITRGVIRSAKKVVIYGPEGIGKTTFASQFPDPLFIDTEGSTKELDVARLPVPSSWAMIKKETRYVLQHPDCCKTLVIDTADWAEKMAIQSVLDEHNKSGIEDFGYGNGYRYVFERFGELLNLLNEVVSAGVNVVLTAHATLKKFEQPDELGAYDRYSMKLIDSPKTSISAAVKEWADMVLFANYKTIVITDSKTKKTKAHGGARVMYTTHHSCWDAKNRFGLQDELPFKYDEIRSVIEGSNEQKSNTNARKEQTKTPEIAPEKKPEPAAPLPGPEVEAATPAKNVTDTTAEVNAPELDPRIPKALRDLMIQDDISEWDVENFVTSMGWMPFDTRIRDYDTIAEGFTNGAIVAQWDKVRDRIRQAKKDQEIPFI